jgi:hypothetical protein
VLFEKVVIRDRIGMLLCLLVLLGLFLTSAYLGYVDYVISKKIATILFGG